MTQFTVAALYKFVSLPDYVELRDPLQALCVANDVFGTILLAEEGINGTVAGPDESIAALLAYLRADSRFADVQPKYSWTDEMPFLRMKVRLKKEIVTMGEPDIDPNDVCGVRVDAKKWNELVSDPETLVIDTRNEYEVELGTFANALSPHTETFRQFPEYVRKELKPSEHKRVAMFCTGGIRCEKATAFMLKEGFDEVYHLDGGILKYLETVAEPEAKLDNHWQGECFVFDDRVSVDAELNPGEYLQCHACRRPLHPSEIESPDYQMGVSCPHCIDQVSEKKKAGLRERQLQIELARERGEQHLGSAQKVSN